MKRIKKRILFAMAAAMLFTTAASAAEVSFDRDTRNITLTGSQKGTEHISVLILKPGASLAKGMSTEQIQNSISIPYEITPDEQGGYKAVLMAEDLSGVCNVLLNSETTKEKLSVAIYSEQDLADALTVLSAAAAEGKDAVEALLLSEETRNILMVEEYYRDPAIRKELYQTLAKQGTYTSYQELGETLKPLSDKLDCLKGFNEAINKVQIPELIEQLYTCAYTKDTYYAKYDKLKSTDTIDRAIFKAKPYASLEAVYEKFKKEVNDYKESTSGSSSGGVGIGRGDIGSGAGIVVGGKYTNTATNTLPVQATATFTDVSQTHWANQAVEALAKAGVVAGITADTFEPDRAIKREEFVKMLVCVLNLSGGEDTFTDTDKNSWYSGYLASAFAAGLVSGKADGSFGVGETLTRQDMAVLVYRAAELANVGFELGSELGFIDASAVSEYAKEGVSALSSAGLINGMGNNCFEPLSSATRAQTARVIFELMNRMEGAK